MSCTFLVPCPVSWFYAQSQTSVSMPSFSFILLTISEKKNFDFFLKATFMSPGQPIKSSDLDKSRLKHGGLLNKHFCKKKLSNIPNDLAKIVNFHFSHYKSMETLSCHSNQSSYPTEIKNIAFVEGNVLSKYAKFRLQRRCRLKMLTDGRRTDAGCLYIL